MASPERKPTLTVQLKPTVPPTSSGIGDHTLAELSSQFDVHTNQILDWKNQLLTQSTRVFESAASKPEPDADLKALHAKIGHQALQIDFLESALSKAGSPQCCSSAQGNDRPSA